MGHDNPARPYAFERIFALSAVSVDRSPQDLALQLLALQAELEQQRLDSDGALAQARADGFTSGVEHARSETAAALLIAEATLAAGIAALDARFAETETRIASAAAEVALAAADQLAARAITDDPALAIDAAIARVLTQVGFRETLHVHVHPSLSGSLHELLAGRQSAEQRPLAITVHGDKALPLGDAHIMWDQGGLSLDAAARKAAVREALGLATATA